MVGQANINARPLGESARTGKQARIWGKLAVEKQSSVLGDADPDSVFPADFIIPFENIYKASQPPSLYIELRALKLFAPVDSVHTTPPAPLPQSPLSDITPSTMDTAATSVAPEIHTYPAAVTFSVAEDYDDGDVDVEKEYTFCLSHDVYFVTAHPCVPSQHVKILKSPSSPTIQQIDLDGGSTSSGSSTSAFGSKPSSSANITCKHTSCFISCPLFKDNNKMQYVCNHRMLTGHPTKQATRYTNTIRTLPFTSRSSWPDEARHLKSC